MLGECVGNYLQQNRQRHQAVFVALQHDKCVSLRGFAGRERDGKGVRGRRGRVEESGSLLRFTNNKITASK